MSLFGLKKKCTHTFYSAYNVRIEESVREKKGEKQGGKERKERSKERRGEKKNHTFLFYWSQWTIEHTYKLP